MNQWSALFGFLFFSLVCTITIIRKRNLDRSDLGALAASYTAASSLPRAAYLIIYIYLPGSKEELKHTKLEGFNIYITFAGLALLFLSLVTLWNFINTAYQQKKIDK